MLFIIALIAIAVAFVAFNNLRKEEEDKNH